MAVICDGGREEKLKESDINTTIALGLGGILFIAGLSAAAVLLKRDKKEEEKEEAIPFLFEDGCMGRLYDFNGDSIVDAIVRCRTGQRPVTEFAAPEYMGKTPWHFPNTREMDAGLRNTASTLYQVKKGFSHQINKALRRK